MLLILNFDHHEFRASNSRNLHDSVHPLSAAR
ncbi:hypothetical protein SKA58_19600 [Sphingomonas sp. SKA58]|jgi:hypothetical protein|nr:hypothetical protein SKA58_19600 [Sphingomonas sp. SKA58]